MTGKKKSKSKKDKDKDKKSESKKAVEKIKSSDISEKEPDMVIEDFDAIEADRIIFSR